MNEIKNNICFFLKPIKSFDVKTAIDFADFIAEHFCTTYTKFGYNTVIDRKEITKNYKYSAKNLEKLKVIKSTITSIYFDSLNEKQSHIDTNLTFIMSMLSIYDPKYPTTIIITVDQAILDKSIDNNYLTKLIEQVTLSGYDLEYGIAFPMDKKKLPTFFLRGIQTPELDQEEREIANALALHKREYRNKIWDIFWYNIIKKELLTETVLDSIKGIVNRSNIVEVGDKYIIALPLEQYEYINNKEKLNKYRNRLRKIFSQVNMIMYEG